MKNTEEIKVGTIITHRSNSKHRWVVTSLTQTGVNCEHYNYGSNFLAKESFNLVEINTCLDETKLEVSPIKVGSLVCHKSNNEYAWIVSSIYSNNIKCTRVAEFKSDKGQYVAKETREFFLTSIQNAPAGYFEN